MRFLPEEEDPVKGEEDRSEGWGEAERVAPGQEASTWTGKNTMS